MTIASISPDGVQPPRIYLADDIFGRRPNSTLTASPLVLVDGQPVEAFVEKETAQLPQNFQDPDAQYNSASLSPALNALGGGFSLDNTVFEIPDNYTLTFENGTTLVVQNAITALSDSNLSGIRSGQDIRDRFEIPSQKKKKKPQDGPGPDQPQQRPPPPKPEPTILGYPVPVAKHSTNVVSGYLLNDSESRDTVVLSILAFDPLIGGVSLDSEESVGAFLSEARDVVSKTFQAAEAEGRDKLVIDMSGNPGGLLDLADLLYAEVVPGGKFDAFDRFRSNDNLQVTGEIVPYKELAGTLVGPQGLPQAPGNKTIDKEADFVGPFTVQGQNVTAPFQTDKTKALVEQPKKIFLKGYGPGETGQPAPRFKPEKTVIMTDGTCASACTIFTGLLVRNFNVRTVAMGGRAMQQPMQAIGGVRGSQIFDFDDIRRNANSLGDVARDAGQRNRLRRAADKLPSLDDAPLLPAIDDAGQGSVNYRNAYAEDDVDGLPLHFQYEAANCRLFYTAKMMQDVSETWRQAARVAWRNGTCVAGSTVNQDGTMGAGKVALSDAVRGRAPAVPLPTAQVVAGRCV